MKGIVCLRSPGGEYVYSPARSRKKNAMIVMSPTAQYLASWVRIPCCQSQSGTSIGIASLHFGGSHIGGPDSWATASESWHVLNKLGAWGLHFEALENLQLPIIEPSIHILVA